MELRNRARQRRNSGAVQTWTAISADARNHFQSVAAKDCSCSACWLLRANGLTAPPQETSATA